MRFPLPPPLRAIGTSEAKQVAAAEQLALSASSSSSPPPLCSPGLAAAVPRPRDRRARSPSRGRHELLVVSSQAPRAPALFRRPGPRPPPAWPRAGRVSGNLSRALALPDRCRLPGRLRARGESPAPKDALYPRIPSPDSPDRCLRPRFSTPPSSPLALLLRFFARSTGIPPTLPRDQSPRRAGSPVSISPVRCFFPGSQAQKIEL